MNIISVKDLGDFYSVTYNSDIKSNIPKNSTNRDYRKVQEWLKDNKLTVDTLEEKKDKLLILNNQKRIEARDKGVEITVDGVTYLANKETVQGFAVLRGLNGNEPIYWKDKDGKPHKLEEEQQKNLAHAMKSIALGIEKVYMKTEIAINALTKTNIDKFNIEEAWKKGLSYVSK
jgi:hypothetical protein